MQRTKLKLASLLPVRTPSILQFAVPVPLISMQSAARLRAFIETCSGALVVLIQCHHKHDRWHFREDKLQNDAYQNWQLVTCLHCMPGRKYTKWENSFVAHDMATEGYVILLGFNFFLCILHGHYSCYILHCWLTQEPLRIC